ncbi:MAG: hypothetical protein RIE74_13185, partial [Pseudomonadales bacterium]
MIAVASTAYGSIDRRHQLDDSVRLLTQGWSVCSTPAGEFSSPSALESSDPEWIPAAIPGTVAGALRDVGELDWDHPPPLDDQDHWFRLALKRPSDSYQAAALELDGIATLGRVWLGDEHLGDTKNMFVGHRLDLTSALARSESNKPWLYICCRSMTRALAQPRSRARWRTRLVSHRSLRYLRTSLLGRMPGICPAIPVVGPWRDVRLRTDSPLVVDALRIVPEVVAGQGKVRVSARCRVPGELRDTLRAFLDVGQVTSTLHLRPVEDGLEFSGTLEIDRPRLWWPHTHGDPHRYGATLRLETDTQEHRVALAPIGFRTIEIDEPGGAFDVRVNGVKIFCRGACWTPADFLSQAPSSSELRRAFENLQDAGMNMLRVPGTTIYEQEAFYELCD